MRMWLRGALVVGILLSRSWALAAPPPHVAYQGLLLDEQGIALSGSVDIEVEIYDAAVGGSALYEERHPGVEVSQGVFGIELGGGAEQSPPGGFSAALFTAPGERWLQVTVDGERLAPRQQLLSVPYALGGADGPESLGARVAELEAVVRGEWIERDFSTPGAPNSECSGGRFVRKSAFGGDLWVGAELCDPFRYKLFLSRRFDGSYREIGDQAGTGQDHCEFIGAPDGQTRSWVAGLTDPVFFRRQRGEEAILSTPPANVFAPASYVCGVGIPLDPFEDIGIGVFVPFDFPVQGPVSTDCTGERFVARSAFGSLYVGAILCSATEYKLLLSDTPSGPYREIADRAGSGQDHCEVLGAPDGPVTGINQGLSHVLYWRSNRGESFSLSAAPGNALTPDRYRCGVSIP